MSDIHDDSRNEINSIDVSKALKVIPLEQLMQLDYFKNRGRFFTSRAFISDNQAVNERNFSDVIKAFHERDNSGMRSIVGHSDEALEAMFTTFQWLTTSVGREVLSTALKTIGKKVVDIEEQAA